MSSLISICLYILSRKHEKQAWVDFLQRNLSVNGLVNVYMLFNNSTNECKYFFYLKNFFIEMRRISGSLIYYLISDSKELAKYIFDKIQKKISSANIDIDF